MHETKRKDTAVRPNESIALDPKLRECGSNGGITAATYPGNPTDAPGKLVRGHAA